MVKSNAKSKDLTNKLAGLPTLDRPALIAEWRHYFGTEPPARIRDKFLMAAVAYRMQEQALGGLKPATKKFLTRSINALDSGKKQVSPPPPVLRPGTRLLRDWHGVTYEVLILEESVSFKGKQYRSLTEVAKIITGVKWSGSAFFGLKAAARQKGRKTV